MSDAPRIVVTFDELCAKVKATRAERRELAWFLAMLRARKTWEALKEP